MKRELATMTQATGLPRRERYKQQTRLDLALAAFEFAKSEGLCAVRVPQIAAAVGVSPRTFNNYFASKEQAIAWLAGRHAASMAAALRARPRDELLGEALVEAIIGQYHAPQHDGLPQRWLRELRSLVITEPSLYTEYLAAVSYAEKDLAEAVAERLGGKDPLRAQVLAAMVTGAERAAVIHWMRTGSGLLPDTVRKAVRQAVAGLDS